jgi:CBS domain-containing protein/ribosomal protein S27AE
MARVKDVMTKNSDVPKVSTETSVLDAAKLMNKKHSSAVAVLDANNKVVGFFGERTLLTEFVRLNKKPDQVKVGEIMHVLYRIGPDANAKEAAGMIVRYGATRLAVYDGDKFVGWVTLTSLSRYFSRKNLLDRLGSHMVPELVQFRCPNCGRAFLEKVTDREGSILRWQCPNCGYAL